MSTRIMPALAPVLVAGLVTACASAPWQPPAYETAIKHYYEAHASEYNGQCLAPYIDGFAKIEVVEETPQRLKVNARYLYRDWVKDERQDDGSLGFMRECVRYNQRTFVLDQSDGKPRVIAMSGPRRN